MINRAMAKKRSGEGGFTLVELLIVIVILGILAAIVVLAIGGLKDTAQNSSCKAGANTIKSAEDAYFAQTQHLRPHGRPHDRQAAQDRPECGHGRHGGDRHGVHHLEGRGRQSARMLRRTFFRSPVPDNQQELGFGRSSTPEPHLQPRTTNHEPSHPLSSLRQGCADVLVIGAVSVAALNGTAGATAPASKFCDRLSTFSASLPASLSRTRRQPRPARWPGC